MFSQTLAIIAPMEMTNPEVGTPVLPDLSSKRLSYLDDSTITGVDGSPALWPISVGADVYGFGWAAGNDEAFRPLVAAGQGKNGGNALRFTQSQSRRLVSGPANSINLMQPCTIAARVKRVGGTGTQTIFTGGAPSDYLTLQINGAGNFVAQSGPSGGPSSFAGPAAGSDWRTVIVGFNGAYSFIQADNAPAVTGTLGTVTGARLTALRLGSNTAGSGSFADILMDRMAVFSRILSVEDRELLFSEWR